MAEAVAPARARVLAVVLLGQLELVVPLLEVDAEILLVLLGLELAAAAPLPLPFSSGSTWVAAISSVSIPASASIWWRRSSVPEASLGGLWLSTRSSPSISA